MYIRMHIYICTGLQVVFFEGGYSDYEEDRFRRTGVKDPTQIKYKPMPTFA